MKTERVSVVGMVTVDVVWNPSGEAKMRLGGIVHACRALWAIGAEYDVYFIAPDYLSPQVVEYVKAFGASNIVQIGTIRNAPGVMLIGQPDEARTLRYEHLFRETLSCSLDPDHCRALSASHGQFLIFPGEYDLSYILDYLKASEARVHIDIANADFAATLSAIQGPVDTVFTSTSSRGFLDSCGGEVQRLRTTIVPLVANLLILKENRGGSRVMFGSETHDVGAYLRPVVHSVGVGDCFDAVYVATKRSEGPVGAARFAAWVAAEYAATTEPQVFSDNIFGLRTMTSGDLPEGVVVHWERRPDVHIYIAGPDFDYLDRTRIDEVNEALRYHNFTPHRPVQEHGQVSSYMSSEERSRMHAMDVALLQRCQILFAVNSVPDPGTYVEIGYAVGLGKPVVLYDPYRLADNLMLCELPDSLTHTLDEAVLEVFRLAAR